MYIKCSNCSTSFYIKEDQIMPSGRYVRCSKCSHIWHVEKNQLINQATEDIDEQKPTLNEHITATKIHNLPAIIPNNNTKNTKIVRFYTFIIILLLLIGGIIGFYSYLQKPIDVFVEEVSIYKFSNEQVVVKYKISTLDHSNGFYMPVINIDLLDEDYKIVASLKEQSLIHHFVKDNHVYMITKFKNVPVDTFYATVKLTTK